MKCLVTKLQGTVNNYNLPLFGAVKIVRNLTIEQSSYQMMELGAMNEDVKIKVLNGTVYSDVSCESVLASSGDSFVVAKASRVKFYQKLNTEVALIFPTEHIHYFNISAIQNEVNIMNFANDVMWTLNCVNGGVNGSLADFLIAVRDKTVGKHRDMSFNFYGTNVTFLGVDMAVPRKASFDDDGRIYVKNSSDVVVKTYNGSIWE